VFVGIVWHTALTAAPIFLVIQHVEKFTLAMAVFVLCSLWLKRHWWDRLQDEPDGALRAETEIPHSTGPELGLKSPAILGKSES
jgi:hypothetical protein